MNHIIIDLEFNSLPKLVKNNKKFQKCPFEIIEIGAVKLDNNFDQIDTFRMFVKPHIFYYIDKYVATKIHLKTEDLQYGFSFNEVLKYFLKWLENDYIIYTWAKGDYSVMKMNCEYYDLSFEWFKNYVDLQEIYRDIKKDNHIKSVKNVMKELNIPMKQAHAALSDAQNEAEILKYINNKTVLQMDDVYNIKEVSIKEAKIIICPNCHEELIIQYQKRSKSKRFYFYARCEHCDLNLERVIHKIDEENNIAQIQTQLISIKDYNIIVSNNK